MFSIVKAARLSTTELAKLLSVSRVTASLWVNGHRHPHHLLLTKVFDFLDALEIAIEAGKLPLPYTVPRRDRLRVLREILLANSKH